MSPPLEVPSAKLLRVATAAAGGRGSPPVVRHRHFSSVSDGDGDDDGVDDEPSSDGNGDGNGDCSPLGVVPEVDESA